MIQVYSKYNSARLKYILDFIFEDQYELILDRTQLNSEIILNYSDEDFDSKIQLRPSGLLEHESLLEDYHHESAKGDVLSDCFYILTRYEEYISDKKDKFGRFSPVFMSQFREHTLDRPVVDEWVYELKEKLGLDPKSAYNFIPTFDIDNAWAYKNKGSMRTMASTAKDRVNKDKNRLKERKEVMSGKLKDPYDTYDLIQKTAKFNPKVFFLIGDYGKYDRNINWKNEEFKSLIQSIDEFAEVGVHPSFASFGNPQKVKEEKERLENIIGKKIRISRQHFLRMQLPDTYRILESIGIEEDYTMGYAQKYGWRAGTSKSFYFFDLLSNHQTTLKIFPFQYMDGTLNEYMHLSPQEAIETIADLTEKTKKYGGNFIPLWHNETIGNYGIWDQWQEVFNYNISLND